MYPTTVALVDDDSEYAEYLAQHLSERGMRVDVFRDSRDLLVASDGYAYDFYLVDLMLPGIDGVELIKVLRRRSNVGVLVVSGRLAPEVFKQVVDAGADMYLTKPVQFEQVALAIQAVQRRVGNGTSAQMPWKFDRRARQLVAPDGVRVDLSEADVLVLECFVQADGSTVTREALRQHLGREPDPAGADGLNAIIYRLRRRIERSTPSLVPLQARSRVGYVFRAPLIAL